MNMPMAILHHSWKVGPAGFGLGPVVLNLAREQKALGHEAQIWSFDSADEKRRLVAAGVQGEEGLRTFSELGVGRAFACPQMLQAAKDQEGQFDIVHQHGIWTANSRLNRHLRSQRQRPVVIAPHGSLEDWALKRSRWKKKVALALYERANLGQATCLHALSTQEAGSLRAFGLKNPIAVIPNGIDAAWLASGGEGRRFRKTFGFSGERRIMLFLSRITPVKGLPLLLQALSLQPALQREWQLVIAGVDEFGHLGEVREAVRRWRLEGMVRFVGPLYGQDKLDAFAAAELFVLPSLRDAAPMVVLEALGAGVPVLTTKGTPWQEIVDHGCGWWMDVDAGALAAALFIASSCSEEKLRIMGERGRELVRARYMWTQMAGQTIALYRWLLGQAAPPPCLTMV